MSDVSGLKPTVEGTVLDLDASPLAGMWLEVWVNSSLLLPAGFSITIFQNLEVHLTALTRRGGSPRVWWQF